MTMIVAHRGASKRAHENTLEAFEMAVALGADMVELDVRNTADGTLVVFHDPGIAGEPLSRLTMDQLLARAAKQNFRVPTLDEVFTALSGRVKFDVEIKEPECAARIISLARRRLDPASCVFTSFDPRIIAAVKTEDRRLVTGLILANAEAFSWWEGSVAEIIAPEKRLYSSHRNYFAKAHKNGRSIAVWTVDGRQLLSTLLADPVVSAIITNHPDRALALREKRAGRQGVNYFRESRTSPSSSS
jgi:glycerophosphoryl diester phosphodiesterase